MVWYKHPILLCIIACVIPSIGGFLGSLLADTGPDSWFGQLEKPVFNPPNWVIEIKVFAKPLYWFFPQLFFPAWTVLYILMGFASFRVWYKGGGFAGKTKVALIFYCIQLILNWLWTPIFFGLQALLLAFIEIVFMWIFIVITTFMFFRIDFKAGLLMLPYIAWVTFAATLNFSIWYLNRGQ